MESTDSTEQEAAAKGPSYQHSLTGKASRSNARLRRRFSHRVSGAARRGRLRDGEFEWILAKPLAELFIFLALARYVLAVGNVDGGLLPQCQSARSREGERRQSTRKLAAIGEKRAP
jgi:hypothetical protein